MLKKVKVLVEIVYDDLSISEEQIIKKGFTLFTLDYTRSQLNGKVIKKEE